MMTGKWRVILFWFVLIVVLALSGLAAFQFKELNQQELALKARRQELDKILAEIDFMESSLAKFQLEQDELLTFLFAEQDIPGFIDGISRYASESGVVILDMKSSRFTMVQIAPEVLDGQSSLAKNRLTGRNRGTAPEQGIALVAMPITVKAEGGYKDFVSFFNQLEGFEQLLTISNLDMKVTRNYPILSANFVIKIYSFQNVQDIRK
jgi:Tfp pilus assembly protein PilO